MFPIARNYGTNIFNGDVVQLAAGSLIYSAATAATPAVVAGTIGVFVGAEYTTPGGPLFGKMRAQFYPASLNANDIVGYVVDDPQAVFKAAVGVQPLTTAVNTATVNGYVSERFVGTNMALVTGNSGNLATGDSAMCLTGAAVAGTNAVAGNVAITGAAPFRVVGLVPETAVTVAGTATVAGSSTTVTLTSVVGISPGMQFLAPSPSTGALLGDYNYVVTVNSVANTLTVANAVVIAAGGTAVSFVGYPEVYVTWNFGYHSYMNATGV
jgi:hypothetical protein